VGALGNSTLGLVFVVLGAVATFLMFKLWGYPFDHEKLKSAAPPKLMLLHRLIGYAYFGIYLYFMSQMVPRLWTYEVELPARTVAHMILGWAIGIILILKISIVRFFKHLESTLIPFLGCLLFICTFLLIGLSVPFALRESYLSRGVLGQTVFSERNLERVKRLLPRTGLPEEAPLATLASVPGLKRGRTVLLNKCVQCHDLRTVLVGPKTPKEWLRTVQSMALRNVLKPIDQPEQWHVATYLIAITPELQEAAQEKRQQEMMAETSQAALAAAMKLATHNEDEAEVSGPFDVAAAKQTFENVCGDCHDSSKVEGHPPHSSDETRELVARMARKRGFSASATDLNVVIAYLDKTYLK
jgi:mono/diheme cytochrome c family protein